MKKGIIITIVALVFVFCVSIVYAASIGQLSMSGTTTFLLPGDVELKIIPTGPLNDGFHSSTPRRSEGGLNELVEVPSITNYQTMLITVDLLYPMDKRIIVFKIQNIGAVTVQLGNLKTTESDINTTGVMVTWPELDGVTLLSGQTSQEFEIIVEWDLDYYNANNHLQSHIFEATIRYLQPPP